MMRGRLDRISVLFLVLAGVAAVLFVAGFWRQSVWVVARTPTHEIWLRSGKGFVLQRVDAPGPDGRRGAYPALVSVPYVAIAGLLLVVPTVRIVARSLAASRRRRAGRCEVCGYDLRETSDRCPECGTVTPPGRPAAAA
jgi:hypothetical protein